MRVTPTWRGPVTTISCCTQHAHCLTATDGAELSTARAGSCRARHQSQCNDCSALGFIDRGIAIEKKRLAREMLESFRLLPQYFLLLQSLKNFSVKSGNCTLGEYREKHLGREGVLKVS